MKTPSDTPVNRQAALFLSRKRHTSTVEEALDGAMNHIIHGGFKDALANVFAADDFGPEPVVTFKVSIRRDVASPGCFCYATTTNVSHHIGDGVKLYGLKP